MLSSLYKPTILHIISRYGYTSADYETIKSASSDPAKMYFLISLKVLEKLSIEDQKRKIAELFAKTVVSIVKSLAFDIKVELETKFGNVIIFPTLIL